MGEVTKTSVKLWLHRSLGKDDPSIELQCSIHEDLPGSPTVATRPLVLLPSLLGSGTVVFENLKPDTTYRYKLWEQPGVPLKLPDLTDEDFFFRTLPAKDRAERLDFLLMSCHDPAQAVDDGLGGYRVWSTIPQIREHNDLRFALLAGDQIYGDAVQEEVLAAKTHEARLEHYLKVYRKFWSHPAYRKALCSLPSYLMWDDHDITDGWGSRSDSFVDADSSEFRPEWKNLFRAAREAYIAMQAIRCPEPLITGPQAGFDYCFRVGRIGFAIADLRSQRNVRRHQVWSHAQHSAVETWIRQNKRDLDVLFFISPVVVTHGWPQMEKAIRSFAPTLSFLTNILSHLPLAKRFRAVQRLIKRNIQDVGGFRDDLEDAWASDPNREQAEQLLDLLFGLQNPKDGAPTIPVIILSGDIHAAGYSMVYSSKEEHAERPVIEHVCSSPVGSEPMSWLVEAMYQERVRTVAIGTSGHYSAQVSHHHCHRNVVVCSLRRFGNERLKEMQLKLKFYLEGRPQPEVIVSDLLRVSKYEAIDWDRALKDVRAEPRPGQAA